MELQDYSGQLDGNVTDSVQLLNNELKLTAENVYLSTQQTSDSIRKVSGKMESTDIISKKNEELSSNFSEQIEFFKI